MKITLPREALVSALSDVAPVIPSKTPKDLLKNVLLTIIGGTATMIATDQEVGIRREIKDVTAERDGSVILPPGRLVSILREINSDTVELDIGEKSIKIVAGGSKFTLSTVDADEFPEVNSFTETSYIKLKASALKRIISRVQFSVDPDSQRFALGGIAVDAQPGTLTLISTDSRRLAIASAPAEIVGKPIAADLSNLPCIPIRAALALSKSLPDSDEEVWLALLPSSVLAKCGGVTVYGRLIEGRFPRYQDVIPNEVNHTMQAVCGPLYSAVRQAMITQNEESKGADFSFSEASLSIVSKAAEVGESEINIPVVFEGDDLTITFDSKYLGQFLNVIDREFPIVGKFVDGDSAAVFSCGDDYRYIVMPLARDCPST